ncbi:MAG: hypothetical protein U1E22_02320 [Coriobacteriia bacterium]|nr:hypothetical protein [Coriobacteriia bacterium]
MIATEPAQTVALDFMRGCDVTYPGVQRLSLAGEGFDKVLYVVSVEVDYFGRRQVSVLIDEHGTHLRPRVWAADPRPLKHQFKDGSLCMWHVWDPPDKRWVYEDGLVALLDLAKFHLYREERYRETGRWMGPEAPHDLPRHPGSGSTSGGKG